MACVTVKEMVETKKAWGLGPKIVENYTVYRFGAISSLYKDVVFTFPIGICPALILVIIIIILVTLLGLGLMLKSKKILSEK